MRTSSTFRNDTDREMQLCVVVEDVVGGELVQLSQHAQAIVGLVHLQLYIYK